MSDVSFVPSRVKAVIFDLDGTLYRQGPLRRAMAMQLLRAHVFHPIRGVRTVRVLAAYRRAQEEMRSAPDRNDLADAQLRLTAARTGVDEDTVAAWVARWMETAPLEVLSRFPQPGLHDSLQELRAGGLRLGVLSDYRPGPKLHALGIAELFDVVLCSQQEEIRALKPHPRGLQVALQRLGVAAVEALYVGDRVDVDAAAAAAADVPCLIFAGSSHDGPGEGYGHITSLRDITERLELA